MSSEESVRQIFTAIICVVALSIVVMLATVYIDAERAVRISCIREHGEMHGEVCVFGEAQ